MRGIALDLLPQAVHVGLERVGRHPGIVAPNLAQERVAADDAASAVEEFEDRRFLLGQPHLFLAAGVGHQLGAGANRIGADGQDRVVVEVALAEMGKSYDGGQVLRSVEWLQLGARRIAQWYEDGFDLLLTPTIAEPPPPLGEFVQPPDNPLQAIFREAEVILLRKGVTIEAFVDIANRKLESWRERKDVQAPVTRNEFHELANYVLGRLRKAPGNGQVRVSV